MTNNDVLLHTVDRRGSMGYFEQRKATDTSGEVENSGEMGISINRRQSMTLDDRAAEPAVLGAEKTVSTVGWAWMGGWSRFQNKLCN